MSIFHTILNNNLRKLQEVFPSEDLSYLFNVFAIQTIIGLDVDEAEQCAAMDGGGDCALDGVYIDRNKDNVFIHIFQTKFRENPDKRGLTKTDLEKTIHSVEDIFSGNIPRKASSQAKAKIEEIRDVFNDNQITNLPVVNIYFVTNGLLPSDAERERAVLLEEKWKTFRVHYFSTEDILHLLDDQKRRASQIRVKSKGVPYEQSFGEVKGFVTTLPARSLIDIYEKCGKEQVLEGNIRHFLGSNRINSKIKQTAESEVDSKYFWCLNNGVSIVCDYYEHAPDPSNKNDAFIKLENPTIVNGGQTTTVLAALAIQSDLFKNTVDNIDVLARIYETKSASLIEKITEATNSQTPISLRDLKANHSTQTLIKEYFEVNGLYLETKRGEYRTKDTSIASIIQNDSVLQAYVSLFFDIPHQAKSSKTLIFQQYFSKIFEDEDSENLSDLPAKLYRSAMVLRFVREKIRSTILSEQSSFLVHAELALVYAFGVLDRSIKDSKENITLQKLEFLYSKAVTVISRAVASERMLLDEYYSDNKFFKSPNVVDLIKKESANDKDSAI